MKNYYNYNWKRVLDELDGDEVRGISDEEADIRQEIYGDNYVSYDDGGGKLKGAVTLVTAPWALVLLIMISICFYVQSAGAAFYFFFTFLLVGGTLLWNRREPMKIRKHLQNLNKSSAVALRNGEKARVPIGELVVGDVVHLKKGNFVPADIRIISAEGLYINELAVTGEDYPTEKFAEKIDEANLPITGMRNMAFRSTVVTRGEGSGVVVATGEKSEIGKLVSAVFFKDDTYKREYSVERQINMVSFISLIISMIFCGLRFAGGMGEATIGYMIGDMLILNSVSLGAVYLLGVYGTLRKLRDEDILINDVGVLYRLRDIKTFILDKYRLITSSNYYVSSVYVNDELKSVLDIESDSESQEKLKRLNEITTACCEFFEEEEYDNKSKRLKIEYSILRFVFNIDKSMIHEKTRHNDMFVIPFDRERSIKTVVGKSDKKSYRAYTIGEIDRILNMCVSRYVDGAEVPLNNEEREAIKKASYQMAKNGSRIIAAAFRNYNYLPSEGENIESNYVFAGMWGIRESFDEDSVNVFRKLHHSDVKLILNCDENKVAATNIGRELGIMEEGVTAVSGIEMDYLTPIEMKKLLNTCNVYSGINSKHKSHFTNILKAQGKKIAAFGNKLKDISYLHQCDIKVAYGENTSEILKSWSDIYLRTGNFKDMLKVIGRGNKSREGFRSMTYFTIFLLGFLTLIGAFNVFSGIEITAGATVLGIIGMFISGIVVTFGDTAEKQSTEEDRKGHFLAMGLVSSGIACLGLYLGDRFGVFDMNQGANIMRIIFPLISFFSVVSFKDLLMKFNFFVLITTLISAELVMLMLNNINGFFGVTMGIGKILPAVGVLVLAMVLGKVFLKMILRNK